MKHFTSFVICASAFLIVPTATWAAKTHSPIDFREFEYEQPKDPLLFSYEPLNEMRETPADQIEPAASMIKAEIPIGASASDAEAKLKGAGAHCRKTSYGDDCLYTDIQTVDEYVDDIRWHVRLNIADNMIQNLSVRRMWSRH